MSTYRPWERQENEPDKAWSAWRTFRDTRDKIKTAQILGITPTTIRNYAKKYDWSDRVREYDRYIDRETQQAEIDAVAEMRVRHVRLSQDIQETAAAMLARLAEDPDAKVTPKQAAEMLDLGVKMERLARGEAESKTEVSSTVRQLPQETVNRIKEIPDDVRRAFTLALGKKG